MNRRISHALIRSQHVFDRRFDASGLAFISDEHARELRNAEVKPGDVLLNITGDGVTFGRACRVPDLILPACVNQHVAIIRVDHSRCDPGYLLSFLTHPATKVYIESFNSGGSRRAITKGHIESFEIPLPPIAEQKAIARILGTLDDKIELNRRINETLEAMARALFQSWFVNFDPVRAKLDGRRPPGLDAATAALFPGHFEPSVHGSIPRGWSTTDIGSISTRIAMGPFGSRITRDNFVIDGVPVVRGGNLSDGFVDDGFVFLTEEKADDLKASVAHSLDLVFTHRGTLGQVGIIPTHARYPRYVVSQSQMLLKVDRRQVSPWMIYLLFRSPLGEDALLANTSTTGVPAISRPTTSLKAVPVVVPSRAVSERFDEIVEPLFLQRERNIRQSRTLATLRDALLPKLLSGALSVAGALQEEQGAA